MAHLGLLRTHVVGVEIRFCPTKRWKKEQNTHLQNRWFCFPFCWFGGQKTNCNFVFKSSCVQVVLGHLSGWFLEAGSMRREDSTNFDLLSSSWHTMKSCLRRSAPITEKASGLYCMTVRMNSHSQQTVLTSVCWQLRFSSQWVVSFLFLRRTRLH